MCLCKLILYSCRDICLPVFVRVHIIVCGSPYSSFYATLNKSCYTHQKRIQHPLPSLSPVGLWHRALKRAVLRREGCGMKVIHTHTKTRKHAHREKKCVWEVISSALAPKKPYILGQKVSSKRVKNKHRVINTDESCQ